MVIRDDYFYPAWSDIFRHSILSEIEFRNHKDSGHDVTEISAEFLQAI